VRISGSDDHEHLQRDDQRPLQLLRQAEPQVDHAQRLPPGAALAGLLQRPGAAQQHVGGIHAGLRPLARVAQRDGPRGAAGPRRRCCQPRVEFRADFLGRQVVEAFQAELVAEHAQHLPGRPRLTHRARRAR
jgi:hypothetical protein